MRAEDISMVMRRVAELVESKIAVYKALNQVADELDAFSQYCNKERVQLGNLTTDNLRLCYYKDKRKKK